MTLVEVEVADSGDGSLKIGDYQPIPVRNALGRWVHYLVLRRLEDLPAMLAGFPTHSLKAVQFLGPLWEIKPEEK